MVLGTLPTHAEPMSYLLRECAARPRDAAEHRAAGQASACPSMVTWVKIRNCTSSIDAPRTPQ